MEPIAARRDGTSCRRARGEKLDARPLEPRRLEVEHRSRDHARRSPSLETDSDKEHHALRGHDLARRVHRAKDRVKRDPVRRDAPLAVFEVEESDDADRGSPLQLREGRYPGTPQAAPNASRAFFIRASG